MKRISDNSDVFLGILAAMAILFIVGLLCLMSSSVNQNQVKEIHDLTAANLHLQRENQRLIDQDNALKDLIIASKEIKSGGNKE